ncbi:unnamed protein product, partial [Heterosigma akashiwo]
MEVPGTLPPVLRHKSQLDVPSDGQAICGHHLTSQTARLSSPKSFFVDIPEPDSFTTVRSANGVRKKGNQLKPIVSESMKQLPPRHSMRGKRFSLPSMGTNSLDSPLKQDLSPMGKKRYSLPTMGSATAFRKGQLLPPVGAKDSATRVPTPAVPRPSPPEGDAPRHGLMKGRRHTFHSLKGAAPHRPPGPFRWTPEHDVVVLRLYRDLRAPHGGSSPHDGGGAAAGSPLWDALWRNLQGHPRHEELFAGLGGKPRELRRRVANLRAWHRAGDPRWRGGGSGAEGKGLVAAAAAAAASA